MANTLQFQNAMSSLPLPLAQALRRAVNAKSPQEQHNAAYYFFESALKLSAAGQIGIYLSGDCKAGQLNQLLENLTRPSTGHWLALLRETAAHLASRPDSGLLPLAGVHDRLTRKQAMPATRAFLEFAAQISGGKEGRQSFRVLDLFDAIVSYRNQELGHGAQRERGFYAEAAPLLLHATLEAVELLRPVGDLQFVVARDVVDTRSQSALRRFDVLRGDGLHVPLDATLPGDREVPAGRLLLAAGSARVSLHPLLVYEIDKLDRDRVGFLNHVAASGRGETQKLMRVEYLDYDSGDRLEGVDAVSELAALLSKVRGTSVSVEAVSALSQAGSEPAVMDCALAAQRIGDFELLEELGRGGMGIVYKARQSSLRRVVALKVLPPALAGDPVSVARFRREIAALGRCDHPNVVKVLTAGQDGERHFYAMEYVEGSDLAQVCGVLSNWKTGALTGFREGHILKAVSDSRQNRSSAGASKAGNTTASPLPELPKATQVAPEINEGRDYFVRLAEILADAASGVQHLHEHGIIHRDIKPGNIMLTSDGKRAVIMDLGLAQLQDRSLSLTASSVKILGTLRYMPPEQLQHQMLEVTPRADIYSLGATLYELAALAPMFDGDSEARLMQQVLQEEPKAPSRHNASVPRDLETIITVATAKTPNDRYASAGVMESDLRAFARGEPISARAPTTFFYLKLFYRKNRALAHALAAALVILIALSAWFVISLNERRAEAVAARDDAEKQRTLAQEQARLARKNAEEAKAQETRAREEERRAKEAEANALAEAVRAESAERATRQRLAEARVMQADSFFNAQRRGEAKQFYAQAHDELAALNASTFNADLGWAIANDAAPDPIVTMAGSPYDRILGASFSPNTQFCAFGCGNDVVIWNVREWREERRFKGHRLQVTCTAFSPDGARVASGGIDKAVFLWDLKDGRQLYRLVGHAEPVSALSFSPDGNWLASGDWGNPPDRGPIMTSIIIWDPKKGEERATWRGPTRSTASLAFSPDSTKLLACNVKGRSKEKQIVGLQVWSVARGSTLTVCEPEKDEEFRVCAWSRDGAFAFAGSSKGRLCSYDGASFERIASNFVVHGAVISLAAAPEGRSLLISGENGALLQYLPADGKVMREFHGHTTGPSATAFSDRDHILSASSDLSICQWDVTTGEVTRGFDGHSASVHCVAVSVDGRTVVSGSLDKTVKLWDSRTGALIRTLRGHRRYIGSVALSPDGRFVASGEIDIWDNESDYVAAVWNVADGKKLLAFKLSKGVRTLKFSPDSKFLLAGGGAQALQLWDLEANKLKASFEGHTAAVKAVQFSSDGKRLISGGMDRAVILWDTETGKTLNAVDAGQFVFSLQFSADNQMAGVGLANGGVMMLNAETLQLMQGSNNRFRVFESGVDWLSFAPNGLWLVCGSSLEKKVVVADPWSPLSAYFVRTMFPAPNMGTQGEFSRDGKTFVSSNDSRSLSVWDLGAAPENRPLLNAVNLRFTSFARQSGCLAALLSLDYASLPSERFVAVFDIHQRKLLLLREFKGLWGRVAISPDGKRIAIHDESRAIKLIEVQTGRELGNISGGENDRMSFSNDGALFAIGGGGDELSFYGTGEGAVTLAYKFDGKGQAALLQFSHAGDKLAVAGRDYIVRVYALPGGKLLKEFEGHSNEVTDLVFSNDDALLASASNDETSRVWPLAGGEPLVLKAGGNVTSVSFAGGNLVCGTRNSSLSVFDLATRLEIRSQGVGLYGDFAAYVQGGAIAEISATGCYVRQLDIPDKTRNFLPILERAREALAANPFDGAALNNVGRWFWLRGRYDWAAEFFERARTAGADVDLALLAECQLKSLNAAGFSNSLSQLKERGKLTEEQRARASQSAAVEMLWEAKIALVMRNFRIAETAFSQVLSFNASDLAAVRGRMAARYGLGEWAPCLADAETVLKADAKDSYARLLRARCLYATSEYEKALSDYYLLRADDPSGYEVAKYAVLCLQYLARWQEAADLCTEYLKPKLETEFVMLRAEALLRLDKWKEAAGDYATLQKKDGSQSFWFLRGAFCQGKLGEYEAALGLLDDVEARDHNAAILGYWRGWVYALRAKSRPDTDDGKKARAADISSALDWLEQSSKGGFGGQSSPQLLAANRDFDALRAEPRFKALCE